MHEIALLSQPLSFGDINVLDLRDMGHQVANGIRSIIHNNPFHSVWGIGLTAETFHHLRNKGTAVKGGSAYTNKGFVSVGFSFGFGFGWSVFFAHPKKSPFSFNCIL